jgi:hypothetical protein
MADSVEHARKRLEDEWGQVRRRFDEIHAAFDRVSAGKAEDDMRKLLKDLEKTVKRVRTGGLFRPGSNGHHRALKKYQKALEESKSAGSGGSGNVTQYS